MPEELKVGCAKPTGGTVGEEPPKKELHEGSKQEKEVKSMIMVGRKAPDFVAPAY